jgi:hypothetical protein
MNLILLVLQNDLFAETRREKNENLRVHSVINHRIMQG